jgi:hypothetical protein
VAIAQEVHSSLKAHMMCMHDASPFLIPLFFFKWPIKEHKYKVIITIRPLARERARRGGGVITMGVQSLIESGSTCVHDLEINTLNIQDFLPLQNYIRTIWSCEIP